MRNDRLIKKLLDSGLMSADSDTGAVYYKGRVRGYTCKSYEYLSLRSLTPGAAGAGYAAIGSYG